MRLLREAFLILVAAVFGVLAITLTAFIVGIASGLALGGWELALAMLVVMSFGPLVGITAGARLLSLLFRRGENWRWAVALAIALTVALLAWLNLLHPLNRNWGSVLYVGLALLGSAISALGVTLLNAHITRRSQR